MKRLFIFLALSTLFSLYSKAQLAFKSFGLSLGGDIEMPHGLDQRYLLSTAIDNTFDAGTLPYDDGDLVRMECDNGTFRLGMGFTPAQKPNVEIRLSLLSIDGRIDMVRYQLPEENHFIEVNATNSELAVEGLYLFRDQAGKTFSFHVGLGTNVGYSYGGKVHVKSFYEIESNTDAPNLSEETDLTFDQKNSINQRLFVQGGLGIRFLKKMEFGIECRKGLGYRASFDGPFKMTTLKRSLGFSLRCVL